MTDLTARHGLDRPPRQAGVSAHVVTRRPPGSARHPFLDIPVPPDCLEMIRCGALVAVNSSAGKDSQCMTILLSRIVPREQMVVVHAPLAEVEWPGAVEHVENTLPDGVPLILAPVTSGKSLLDSIEERGRFPSPSVRWCTSSTKRGPIERELRRYLRSHPQFGGRLVNAMGMRAEESAARAKKTPWKRSDRNSKAGRSWYDWLPIFDLTEAQVFDVIRAAGQSPHPAYGTRWTFRSSCAASTDRLPRLQRPVRTIPGRGASFSASITESAHERHRDGRHSNADCTPSGFKSHLTQVGTFSG